jgi:lipopolysaccharide heptosyltransferase I
VTDLKSRQFDRILLVKPSSLGDIVHTLPVLHGLRARYPKAKLDWLVAPPFAPLLEGHDELDELIPFERGRFARLGRSHKITGEFATFVRNLRQRRYDLVLDLQGLFRSGWITWATGAPARVGFREAREGAWVFYTHRVGAGDPDQHAVDRNYRVARMLGFEDVPVTFRLPVIDSAAAAVRTLLGEGGIGADHRIVVVAPGARGETKVWLSERFAETIDRIQEEATARCVLVGSPEEHPLCGRIADACGSGPANLAGRTSLPELVATIARADVVLCHDSATVHLAAALQKRLVCLVGPTNPRRTGPYRRMGDVLQAGVPCAPCYLRRLAQCAYGHRCMHELDVDRVVAAVERALTGHPAS